MKVTSHRLIWLGSALIAPLLLWLLREHVPAAGLVVTHAVITQSIDELQPGDAVGTVPTANLSAGIVAFAAIRAPMGVAQSIVFEWRHAGETERIVAEIHGGNTSGWRTFVRKQVFPQNPRGRWTVDILTPQRQLLKRMTFNVT